MDLIHMHDQSSLKTFNFYRNILSHTHDWSLCVTGSIEKKNITLKLHKP
jgi:hypothetical protein